MDEVLPRFSVLTDIIYVNGGVDDDVISLEHFQAVLPFLCKKAS